MNKRIYYLFFSIIFLFTAQSYALSQCGCSASQQFLPPLHWIGSSELTHSAKKRLNIDAMYKHGFSDRRFQGSNSIAGSLDYSFHSFDFFSSYGITHYTSIDVALNYNIKLLDNYGFKSKGYGFSNLSAGIRHVLYETETSDFIVNAGSGFRIPMMKFQDIEKYPIATQPSNGAFGFYCFGLIQKSLPRYALNFLLFARGDFSFKNSIDYFFGPSITSSIFVSRRFTGNFITVGELRYSLLFQDKYQDTIYPNSGANLFMFVPRITYIFSNISISPFVEIPIYQYFKGEQIASKFSFGINFNYVLNLSSRKL